MTSSQPGAEDATYTARVRAQTAWDELYESANLGFALEQLRSDWVTSYDFVLIDGQAPGITDIGAICTAQLPDIVVVGFTANEQSVGGAIHVVLKAQAAATGSLTTAQVSWYCRCPVGSTLVRSTSKPQSGARSSPRDSRCSTRRGSRRGSSHRG